MSDGDTPVDLSMLSDTSIDTQAKLNSAEAKNVNKAFLKYLSETRISILATFIIHKSRLNCMSC